MSGPTGGTPADTPIPETAEGISLARAHLVGVGGAGMSGLARILVDRGLPVSGSDARDSAVLAGLADRGVRVAVGHDATHLDLLDGGPTAVVVSTAVRPDNSELRAARERGIPVVRRADALAALMSGRRAVCVAGTHGKTSTTAMLTVALQQAGADPSFAIGGELAASGISAHHGSGDIFVAEADESDGSFLSFTPHGAVVTNLEPDHLDHHGTAEAYTAVFDQFVDRAEPGGFLGADDPGSAALARRVSLRRVISYGRHPSAAVRVSPTRTLPPSLGSADVTLADGRSVTLALQVPGDHMILNATAALAAGVELGLEPDALATGLAAFTGVRRRFEFKGSAAGVRVYDDYAHHPTEVAAQLRAARGMVGPATPSAPGRLIVVFQPHLYSRTATFAAEFGTALGAADLVVLLDVYAAREDPVPGVTGALIADALRDTAVADTAVHYHEDRGSAAAYVAGLVTEGDVVITMGAGDVTEVGPELLSRLEDG
jgi:UDP-N-acetylmuramate--alanine ligase